MKAESWSFWVTRQRTNTRTGRLAVFCKYTLWMGAEPPVHNGAHWAGPKGCEFLREICPKSGAKFLREAGLSLKPGGGPIEFALKVKT